MAFSYEGTRYSFLTDNVVIREGKMVGSVTYQTDGSGDESMRDSLVQLVSERLAKADSSLP
jgi:hypothetical protein